MFPLIHVYLAFLQNFLQAGESLKHAEMDIPWVTDLAKVVGITLKLPSVKFPEPDMAAGRPPFKDLPYFPSNWFVNAQVDDEDCSLELPSTVNEPMAFETFRVALFDLAKQRIDCFIANFRGALIGLTILSGSHATGPEKRRRPHYRHSLLSLQSLPSAAILQKLTWALFLHRGFALAPSDDTPSVYENNSSRRPSTG